MKTNDSLSIERGSKFNSVEYTIATTIAINTTINGMALVANIIAQYVFLEIQPENENKEKSPSSINKS